MKDLLVKLALASIAVLAPIHTVIISVFILVIADLITGIWAALKTKQNFTSAKLRNSITKALIYQIAVITGFIVETYLLGGSVPVTKIVGGLIGLSECVSVMENCNKILGVNIFAMLITKLGSANLAQNDIKKDN